MKPNALMDVSVQGNLTGETMKMDLDPEARAHLIGVLTNLYSDPLLACIREYSTNAFDANVEAGVTDVSAGRYTPIRVTLPNFASNVLVIEDDGRGMSLEHIRDTFRRYGASTKRDSNDFNGMLGLGSKSALTYTPNFSVVSVHEGMRYSVSVGLDEEGLGEIQVVGQNPTTDPSGVTVSIPIKRDDCYTVTSKAREFFGWWPKGSVLVNGVQPETVKTTQIVGNIHTYEGQQDLIVMGNVAYPVPGDRVLEEEFPRFVYFANIGEVNFSPSRESLRHDKRAKEVINRVSEEFREHFREALQARVDAETTPFAAMIKAMTLNEQYGNSMTFTYKGKVVPGHFKDFGEIFYRYAGEGSTVMQTPEYLFAKYLGSWYGKVGSRSVEDYTTKYVIVTGTPKNMSPHNRAKLRSVTRDVFGSEPVMYYLVPEGGGTVSGWLSEINSLTWDDVNSKYRAKTRTVRDNTVYEMYDSSGDLLNRRSEDTEKYLYVSRTETREVRGGLSLHATRLLHLLGYDYVVVIPVNRHNKFAREHNARHLPTELAAYAQKWAASLPAERVYSIAVGRTMSAASAWKELEDEILCPQTRAILSRFEPELDRPYLQQYDSLKAVGMDLEIPTPTERIAPWPGMPNLRHSYTLGNKDRLEIYNALYLYRKDKSNDS